MSSHGCRCGHRHRRFVHTTLLFRHLLLLLSIFLFPFSVRVDASHPRSFVLNKFLDSFELERCEGLKREWLSVRSVSVVFQLLQPDTGAPLHEERVIAVRVEPDMHFESYQRDVTDEIRSPWNLRCGVKEFTDGDQCCAETREYSAACLSCDCQDDTEHCGNPNCARADDLTEIPEVQVVAMFHTFSFLFVFLCASPCTLHSLSRCQCSPR